MSLQDPYQRPTHLISVNQTQPDISCQQGANSAASPTAQLDLILQMSDLSVTQYLIDFHNRIIHLAGHQNNVTASSILTLWGNYGIGDPNCLSVEMLHLRHQGIRLFSEEFLLHVLNVFPLYKNAVEDQQISDDFSGEYKNHRLVSENLLQLLNENRWTQGKKVNSLYEMLFEFLSDEYQQHQFIEQ